MAFTELGSDAPNGMGDFSAQIEKVIEATVRAQVSKLLNNLPAPQIHVAAPSVSVSAPAVDVQCKVPEVEPPDVVVDFAPLVAAVHDLDTHVLAMTAAVLKPVTRTVTRDSSGYIVKVTESR